MVVFCFFGGTHFVRSFYESPFSSRYASRDAGAARHKFKTRRTLWIALAEAEELGLDITQEQIDELKAFRDDINYELAEEIERETRHDVMSHIRAYGAQCKRRKG